MGNIQWMDYVKEWIDFSPVKTGEEFYIIHKNRIKKIKLVRIELDVEFDGVYHCELVMSNNQSYNVHQIGTLLFKTQDEAKSKIIVREQTLWRGLKDAIRRSFKKFM